VRLVIECAGKKVEYPLTEGTLIVGRDSSCDICFPDPSLSRRHLMCALSGLDVRIRDLSSKNGTFLGPQRVSEVRLQPGVRIRAGNCFICAEEEAQDATVAEVEQPSTAPEPVEEAPGHPPMDLESRVPDDENFEQEEEPTPVDESIPQAVAAENDEEARLLVRDNRWFVQDPATGVEVEIVPLGGGGSSIATQPEQTGGPLAVDALRPAALPAVRPRGRAGALVPVRGGVVPGAAREQSWLGKLLTDRKKRRRLIAITALCALAAVLAAVLLKSKPPPPPISASLYRREVNRAVNQYAAGNSELALATLQNLQKMPMNFKPRVAEMFQETILADVKMEKSFAKGYEEAQKRWKEVREDSKTPAELRKIAKKRSRWIDDEENNYLSLTEARRYVEAGDFISAERYARNVREDSMFRKEADPIIRQAHAAVIKGIIERAEAAVRRQKWPQAVATYKEAIEHDDSLADQLKPKIALYERYQRELTAYNSAQSLAQAGRHADALRQLDTIVKDSPYAKNAASLRAQCEASGSSQAALTAYNGGNGDGALKILDKAGLKSGGLYSKIQRVLEVRAQAWQAMKEGKFQTAENAWKTVTGIETDKNNHYVKEALRELQYLPQRKRQMAEQFVKEANEALERLEYKAARLKFFEALLLNPDNQNAVNGRVQLRKKAQLEYNLALNDAPDYPEKALERLRIAAACLDPTDDRFQNVQRLIRRIKERMKKGSE